MLSVKRPMAPRPVLGHTSTTRARNIAGPVWGEWPAASPLPPPGDSHMCSPGLDLGTGGGLSLKSTKISYQKNYAKKYILGTSYLIIEIFICIPVWT